MREKPKGKVFLKIVRYGVYAVLFTPLIYWESFIFPSSVSQAIFFRILTEVIFAAYIFLILANPRYRPRFNYLTVAISVFLGISILSSFTGVDLQRSFWGSFERMGGTFSLLHFFALFVVLISVFRERKDWEKLLTFSILGAVIFVFCIFLSDQFSIKDGGTIGNASLMVTYLLFNIFFALILFLAKKNKWRIFYGTAFLLSASVLLVSGGRAAIASFLVGLFLLGLGHLLFFRRKLFKKFVLALILFLMISAGIFSVIQPDFIKDKINAVWEIPSLQARLVVWQLSWQGWKERFWLGWGPENFSAPFAKYFDPRLTLTSYGGEFLFDRAHNIIFDLGIASGIFNLLSYLTILALAIFGLLRISQNDPDKEKAKISLGVLVLLIVYFLQNFWIFDTTTAYLMLFLTLAFAGYLLSKEKSEEDGKKEALYAPLWLQGAAIILIISVIFAFYFGNIREVQAAYYAGRAQASALEKAIPFYQKALKDSPKYEWKINLLFIKRLSESVSDPSLDRKTLEGAFQLAEEETQNCIKKNPLVLELHLFLGRLYNDYFDLTGEPEKLELAEDVLQKAIELSPGNQQGYWELAQVRIFQERYKEAINLIQKTIDLEPHSAPSHWYLAILYRIDGQDALAEEKIKEIEKADLGWVGRGGEAPAIIGVYHAWGDYATQAILFRQLLRSSAAGTPGIPYYWLGLVRCYVSLGEIGKAKEAAQKALELNHSLAPQVEKILNSQIEP